MALAMIAESTAFRDRLAANTAYFRRGLVAAGLTIRPESHSIVPIMLGEATLAREFAARMLAKGVYVVAFTYPVVPMGQARVRT